MMLQTKYVGEVDIEQANSIRFPYGLPGFVDETEFVLLDIPGNNVFQTLQSTKTSSLAFVVTNPYHFHNTYEFKLDTNILESLEIKKQEDVAVLTIVTLKSPFSTSTLNLKAPVIINTALKIGKQYILNTDDYSTKALIDPSDDVKARGE